MIISFINQKGGVGKSTCSAHLARWLSIHGNSVSFVDCDPQQSSSEWLASAGGFSSVHRLVTADEIMDRLLGYGSESDYCIVDSAGGLTETIRSILLRTDLAIIPVGASGLDVRSTLDTIRLCEQARSVRRDRPRVALALTKAKKQTRLKAEALEFLGGLGVPLLKQVVHDRQVVADSFGQNSFVFDIEGKAAADASKEFHSLFSELIKL